jgi:hypothetical protein
VFGCVLCCTGECGASEIFCLFDCRVLIFISCAFELWLFLIFFFCIYLLVVVSSDVFLILGGR